MQGVLARNKVIGQPRGSKRYSGESGMGIQQETNLVTRGKNTKLAGGKGQQEANKVSGRAREIKNRNKSSGRSSDSQ